MTDQNCRQLTELFEEMRFLPLNKDGAIRLLEMWFEAVNKFESSNRKGAQNLVDGSRICWDFDHAVAGTKGTAPASFESFGMNVCEIEIGSTFC
jgi:hypothetical protein